jgi:hypothetical protein
MSSIADEDKEAEKILDQSMETLKKIDLKKKLEVSYLDLLFNNFKC